MQDHLLAAADDLVGDGIRETGIPLTETLRHYMAITLARFMQAEVALDRLTIRIVQAMDRRASPFEMRDLADTCLIACSVFSERLGRAGGSLRHYTGMGQVAYEAATLTEQAYGFAHMRDVIAAGTGHAPQDMRRRLDAARAGSPQARSALAQEGILPFTNQARFLS